MPCLTRPEGAPHASQRYRVSLRFANPLTEAFYVRNQKPALLWHLKFVLVILVLIELGITAQLLLIEAQAGTAATKETYRLNISMLLGLIALNVATCFAVALPRVASTIPPAGIEALTAAIFGVHTVSVFPLGFWYGARLLGHDPESIWDYGSRPSETRSVMAFIALIMLAHLMPLRWVVLAPLEAIALLTYAIFAFGLGGPDGAYSGNTLLILTAMVALTAVSRRSVEQLQRSSLYDLIRERRIRVETEFRLEQSGGRAPARDPRARQEDLASLHESRPETTESAAIFRNPDLDGVAALGMREQWYIDPSEFTLTSEVLGEGSFGLVLAGSFHGSQVAVKVAKMHDAWGSEHHGALASFLNEAKVLRRLRHPNIALFYGASISPSEGEVCLVLERLRGVPLTAAVLEGDLQKQALPPSDLLRALLDVCQALRYLHSRQPAVVHGDLTPQNTHAEMAPGSPGLIRAKLLDFGLSRLLTRHAEPPGGSLQWMAPEVVLGQSAPRLSSDVFSFGRLAFFTLTGESPCQVSRITLRQQLRAGRVPELAWSADASTLACACQALVEACSSAKAGDRPTMAEAHRQLEALEGRGAAPSQEPEPPRIAEGHGGPPATPEEVQEEPGQGGQGELWLSSFGATPGITQHRLLIQVMGRVNLAKKGGQCCLMHARVERLRGELRELGALLCQELPAAPACGQCTACGTLFHARDAAKEGGAVGAEPGEVGEARCPVCADDWCAAARRLSL